MPNASRTASERLSALIAEVEAEAYARGQADAKKEILDLLGTGGEQAVRTRGTRGRRAKAAAAPKRRASGRKRAPKGSVPRFVEQALRASPGLTPPEILARAATDMERLIKLPSIRTELRNGRNQGKYDLDDGRWSLAGSNPAPEATASPPSPAASETAQGEGTIPSRWSC